MRPSSFANSATNYYTGTDVSGGAIHGDRLHGGKIVNSTFSGNEAKYNGGGILVNSLAGYTTDVYNCTFVANTADGWSGGLLGHASVLVESCLFADNTAHGVTTGFGASMQNVVYSNCVYEGTIYTCTDRGGNTNVADAMIDTTLADNGGQTMTHALLAGSPAIDAGSNPAGLSSDQRGTVYLRVYDSVADCGAFERQPDPGAPDPESPEYRTISVAAVINSGADVSMQFTTIPGRLYTVQYKTNIMDHEWQILPSCSNIFAVGDAMTVIDSNAPDRVFYRFQSGE